MDFLSKRFTSINFAENQLSPSSIGFSPLTTSHPNLLPQTQVQSSKMYYHFFNLLIARSPGFGSRKKNLLRANFVTPPLMSLSLLFFLTRWPIMQKVRRISTTDCFYRIYWFYFTSRFQLDFFSCLSFTVLVHYRSKKMKGLEGGSPFYFFSFQELNFLLLSLKKWQGFYLLWQGFPLLFRLRANLL